MHENTLYQDISNKEIKLHSKSTEHSKLVMTNGRDKIPCIEE